VGLLTFDLELREQLPPASGKAQLTDFVRLLETARPDGRTDVKILFHRLAEELHHRSMVVLVSDLLADPDDVIRGLEHIRLAQHELIVMHVLHDDEWSFPFVDNVLFEGLEEQQKLMADPQSLRAGYHDALQSFVGRVRAACLNHGIDYVPVNTRDRHEVVLSGYLVRHAGQTATGTRR
jgi:uncharacterized protein (DUF58 family)